MAMKGPGPGSTDATKSTETTQDGSKKMDTSGSDEKTKKKA